MSCPDFVARPDAERFIFPSPVNVLPPPAPLARRVKSLRGMTNVRLADQHNAFIVDLGALERTLLDVGVPLGSALLTLAMTWLIQPRVVENAFHQLDRFARLLLG